MAIISKLIEGLINDETYFTKVFTVNHKERVNNRLDLPFASATPFAYPALSTMPQGTIILVNEDGTPVEYVLLKNDYEADINGAGRTLLMRKETAGTTAWAIKYNTWADSTLKETMDSHKLKYDSDVQEAIEGTHIEMTAGENSPVSVLNIPVFPLSENEAFGLQSTGTNKEGDYIEGAIQYCVASSWLRTIECSSWSNAMTVDNGFDPFKLNVAQRWNYQPCIAPLNAYGELQADGRYKLVFKK